MSYTPGPLPEPHMLSTLRDLAHTRFPLFSEAQMRAHTAAEVARAVAAERERCAYQPLDQLLTEQEAAFVRLVFRNPGAKLNGGEAHTPDWEPLWPKVEALGLIEAVGSYKWVPTERLVVCAATIRADPQRLQGTGE